MVTKIKQNNIEFVWDWAIRKEGDKMYNIIVVFFPSLISIKMDANHLKQKYDYNTVVEYLIYCLLNNTIVLLAFLKLFKINPYVWNNINVYPGMMIKYSVISIMVAIGLSTIRIIIKKNVVVEIEIENK